MLKENPDTGESWEKTVKVGREATGASRSGGPSVTEMRCYGRLAVVSNVDDGGFALNVDKELRGSAMLYQSKYNGAMLGSRWM
jgi:hypothetical protein